MAAIAVAALAVAALGGLWVKTRGVSFHPLYQESLQPGELGTVAVASPEDALTFAREAGSAGRVIAVTRYEAGYVEGVDLGRVLGRRVRDPRVVFRALGYSALRDLISQAAPATRLRVRADGLGAPVDLDDHHILAGINFPEHAGEVGVEDGPFLFPKLVAPTGPHDVVRAGDALLDYEGEVAFLPLEPLAAGDRLASVAVLLANDFTARDVLMHHIDFDDIASGAGFTTGKSFPGFLPVGDLMLIPRDRDSFLDEIEIRLYVNGRLRQRSLLSKWIWDLDELVRQTWARRTTTWDHNGEQVSLLGGETTIGYRTLILSGTPQGTVFSELPLAEKVAGVVDWLLGGWTSSIPEHAVDNYIGDARDARIYLQPGDRVTMHVDRLGVIDTKVIR